jgi:hypothetical protein
MAVHQTLALGAATDGTVVQNVTQEMEADDTESVPHRTISAVHLDYTFQYVDQSWPRIQSVEMSEQPNELLEGRDNLLQLQEAIKNRLANASAEEKLEIESLSKRANEPSCSFDRKHRKMLYSLALFPEQVGPLYYLALPEDRGVGDGYNP